jgi:hypothetical protein
MEINDLGPLVHRAAFNLLRRDGDLLTLGASEWALAHRLAVYLETEVPGWHVDCEYDRQGTGRDLKRDGDGDPVRPDIIVHHRGATDLRANLLVLELKKREDREDWMKANEYTRPPRGRRIFQYQFGLALTLEPLGYRWYQAGRLIEPGRPTS